MGILVIVSPCSMLMKEKLTQKAQLKLIFSQVNVLKPHVPISE